MGEGETPAWLWIIIVEKKKKKKKSPIFRVLLYSRIFFLANSEKSKKIARKFAKKITKQQRPFQVKRGDKDS